MRKTKAALLIKENDSFPIAEWLKHLSEKLPDRNLDLVHHACVLAQLVGEDKATPIGLSCLRQGLITAEILSELNVDNESLAAAILFSCVKYTNLKLTDVREPLGEAVAKLIKGTMQMDAIHNLHTENEHHSHEHTNIDNLRKMLLAMVDDVRVVLIKLAERLCILRNMSLLSEKEKESEARETLDIYAPLANRLGIWHLKWELEDLSFRYLESERYKKLSKSLNLRRDQREKYVSDFMLTLQGICKNLGVKKADVTGRAKHIYSIHKKMQRKNVGFSEIYDAIAFRVLVPEIEDCYAILGHIHATWEHIPSEFDDYVAQPKPNGYRSIHTAIIGPDSIHVEIQMRTYDMHDEAELGVAAHWVYKESGKSTNKAQTDYEAKIAWLRQVMDWQKEVAENDGQAEEKQARVFDDRVYVFTPTGDVMDLPKGATPLDFAYQVHSEIGHRCRGAKVNNKMVPLTYELKTGESVDILTAKIGQPSRDWLNPHQGYLHTARAKAKVHAWFRKQDLDINIASGQTILEKELKRLHLKNVDQTKVAHKLKYKNSDELYAALGRGDIRIHAVLQAVQHQLDIPEIPAEKAKPFVSKTQAAASAADIDIRGVGNLMTNIARCCKPIPGDPITGYITQGRGISIHRQDCPNVLKPSEYTQKRLIEVGWGKDTNESYAVDLIIDAYDRHGLVRDITNLLSTERISILGLNCITDNVRNTAHVNLTVEIDSLNPLSRIITRLGQLPNVNDVKRIK